MPVSKTFHLVKSVRVWSYSGPHFPAFGLTIQSEYIRTEYSVRIGENVDQNDSEYGQFLHSGVNSLRGVFTTLANIYDGTFLFKKLTGL